MKSRLTLSWSNVNFPHIALIWLFALHVQAVPNCARFQPTVLVHGGAGAISDDNVPAAINGVKRAACRGYEALQQTGSVMDAVEQAVQSLEEDPSFNAGYGSALTWEGEVEMDAAIMHGAELKAGCVSLARDIMHPISLARRIMETTRHQYLAGEGAMHVAKNEGFQFLPKNALITDKAVKSLQKFKASLNEPLNRTEYGPPGTVGAVAIDGCGNVAAATSTGGITGKLSGRIGDSPLLGAGTYADNETGALSATGHGETIMRFNLASRVLGLVQHGNYTVQQAAEQMLKQMTKRFNQTAGLIAIDHRGQLGIYTTTKRMSWAYRRESELHYGIDAGEDQRESVNKSS